jgi:hypothetical protein
LRAALLVLLAVVLPAAAQRTNDPRDFKGSGKSDWELEQDKRELRESEVKLPAAPRAESLIEFFPSSATSFRFFIDSTSLAVEPEGVIRYVLVARSPSGHDNVTYEGMRCSSNSIRVYAYGNAGTWSRSSSDWKPIEARSVQRWHNELRSRYFCPLHLPIQSTAEGLDALRRGGHPMAERNASPGRF